MIAKLEAFGLYALGALLLMFASFYNGFPLIFSDTGTYIDCGFNLNTPADRPMTYGLFIAISSFWGFSIWLSIFLQSLILSYLIFRFTRTLLNTKKNSPYSLIIILLLCLTSTISWIASHIMADVFNAIMVLTTLIILYDNSLKSSEKFLVYFLLILSTSMHISHWLINIVFIVSFLFYMLFFSNRDKKRIQKVLLLLCITVVCHFSMNSAVSKSKYIFLSGRLIELGILKEYLAENCSSKSYKLCQYKDELPESAVEFLWNNDSPLALTGGWDANKDELKEIIQLSLRSPKHIITFVKGSINSTMEQLLCYQVGAGNLPFGGNPLIKKRIQERLPNDYKKALQSKQNSSQLLPLNKINLTINITLLVSFISLIVYLFFFRENQKQIKMILFVLFYLLLTAWVNATFSTVTARFSKLIWLIPFLSFTIYLDIIISLFRNRIQQ